MFRQQIYYNEKINILFYLCSLLFDVINLILEESKI